MCDTGKEHADKIMEECDSKFTNATVRASRRQSVIRTRSSINAATRITCVHCHRDMYVGISPVELTPVQTHPEEDLDSGLSSDSDSDDANSTINDTE